jgi:hypothetical protein
MVNGTPAGGMSSPHSEGAGPKGPHRDDHTPGMAGSATHVHVKCVCVEPHSPACEYVRVGMCHISTWEAHGRP